MREAGFKAVTRRAAMRCFAAPLLAVSSLASVGTTQASTFNISPIRAELSTARRTEALTLMNATDDPVVVQVHVVSWSQADGEEQLEDTRELLATPPVLQIPGNGQQIVRVALRREPDLQQELTYRIIFEEVPQAAPLNFTGLRVALRLSVPVFIAPLRGKPSAQLAWESKLLANGQVELLATNHGSAHLQITDFDALIPGASAPLHGLASKYVLPGSRMSWTFVAPAGMQRGAIPIHGHSDKGDFSADAAPSDL